MLAVVMCRGNGIRDAGREDGNLNSTLEIIDEVLW